jgi:hypothetical protein
LVFAADLEQIEEVGGRGMDRDKVFIRLRSWRGEIDDLELFWPLCNFRFRLLASWEI